MVLVGLLYRLLIVSSFWDEPFTFSFGYLVKGVPVSDGRNWDTLATEFALGRLDESVGARRPVYWVFMGSIYALTGPSVPVTQAVHVLLSTLSVGLIFEICRRVASTRIAFIAALAQAISFEDAILCMVTATEPLGAFLSNASLFALVLGAGRLAPVGPGEGNDPAGRSRAAFVTSGVLLGIANVARPLNLAAIGLWPFLLYLAERRSQPPACRRRLLSAAGLLIAGCALTLLPWLVLQRAKYGSWMTDSGAETLYVATLKELEPAVTSELPVLTRETSVRERSEFFGSAVLRNLKDHPGVYARNSLAHAGRVLDRLTPEAWLGFVTCAMFLLSWFFSAGSSGQVFRVLAACAAVASGVLVSGHWIRTAIWLGGAVLVTIRRQPMSLLTGLLLATTTTVAVAGRSGDFRFTYSSYWMATALFAWLLFEALNLATVGRLSPHPWNGASTRPRGWGRMSRIVQWTAATAAVVWTIGLAYAVGANMRPPAVALPATLSAAEAAPWAERVLHDDAAAPYRGLGPRLEARRGTIRRDYVMSFAAGESVNHWSPLYREARPYAFQVFETWPSLPEYHAVFPGDTRALVGQATVLIGVHVPRPLEGTTFEVIAIAVGGGSTSPLLRPRPEVARAHATHLAALMRGTP